ncbi:ABC transporter ATP-binding protein [Roseburia inulinivorans]|uniref:Macrolide export ATP-binding/permease protein MacB n=1 Tax=Roseburia inulinivorans TaxID=360807 RepID=A0A173RZK7_9FIRM|nr:ATP-binding cassette domain-containing protein [Roseburia inulinivorans]CUM83574.1 Macrolide export ATP-binding/permease protein MacB [Roseburia inulinivorans]
MNKFVEIKNVNKHFGEKRLFDNFSCDIKQGDFVVITGASGCGKTTLLNMIGGLESVTSGKISVAGLEITNQKNLQIYYRDIVGFVFQNFALVEQKTVEENLKMIHKKGQTEVSVQEALRSVGMEKALKQKVYSLSGGEQQRIALARLRLKNCQLILADEPTGSLDRKNGQLVMEILHEMNAEGKTVIMVTHDESLIQDMDKRISL